MEDNFVFFIIIVHIIDELVITKSWFFILADICCFHHHSYRGKLVVFSFDLCKWHLKTDTTSMLFYALLDVKKSTTFL